MTRLWIPGYTYHYSINHLGEVWSHKHNKIKVKMSYLNKGYPVFSVYKYPDKPKLLKVHRVLAELFLPSWDPKLQVNHINGIKTDNRLDNLEMCTGEENVRHAINTGLISGLNSNAKLSLKEVVQIRDLKSFYRLVDIANMYDVSTVTISRIVNYRSWKNV